MWGSALNFLAFVLRLKNCPTDEEVNLTLLRYMGHNVSFLEHSLLIFKCLE